MASPCVTGYGPADHRRRVRHALMEGAMAEVLRRRMAAGPARPPVAREPEPEGQTYPDWHVVQVPCTTCPSGVLVAVQPAWTKRARCGTCIQAGTPYAGDLVPVADRPAPVRGVTFEIPGKVVKVTRAELELPPPEHTSRQPWPEDFPVPGPVAALRDRAEAGGWVTHTQYARGWKWGVGTNMSLTHSVGLRCVHESAGLVAMVIYESKVVGKPSWTAGTVWVTGRALPAYGGLGVVDLKGFLQEAPGLSAAAVRAYVDRHRAGAAVKAAERKAETERKRAKGVTPKRKVKEGAA